jgi:hypothetical protein
MSLSVRGLRADVMSDEFFLKKYIVWLYNASGLIWLKKLLVFISAVSWHAICGFSQCKKPHISL